MDVHDRVRILVGSDSGCCGTIITVTKTEPAYYGVRLDHKQHTVRFCSYEVEKIRSAVFVPLSEREHSALYELAADAELPPHRIMLLALRYYQTAQAKER